MPIAVGGKTESESIHLPLATSPDDLELWLSADVVAEPPIYGSNGDRLPPVAFSMARFEWLKRQSVEEKDSILQRQMIVSTLVSEVTGCLLPKPERSRTHGGYVPAHDKGAAVSPSSSTSRHRAVFQRINVPKGRKPLTPMETWEHYCRTPACSHDGHGEMMPIELNVERKNQAKTLEYNLRANQPMMTVAGMEWLEPHINEAGEGLVPALLCTRYGVYILEVINGAIHGHYLSDPVREAMRQPAPYPRQKEKVEVHSGQLSLDPAEMYHDLLRRAIAKRKQEFSSYEPVAA